MIFISISISITNLISQTWIYGNQNNDYQFIGSIMEKTPVFSNKSFKQRYFLI
ncbi:hypothetical protein pb186bvf_015913 [Paramecium bursaria]